MQGVSRETGVSRLAHLQYRPDVDGLRAIAVIFVVIYHAFPGKIPGGFVGVDIFFVVSGYLISSIIFSNLEADRFSIIAFYSRRIRRIFPALILVMSASLVFGWFTLFADEYRQLAKHVAGGATFVSNFVFYKESGYFDNSSHSKPMLHLWSLAIEEQFYIFWPLLLSFVWKRKWNFLRITAVIAVLSFAVNIYQVGRFPSAAYYWPFSRFWELMIGGILAYLVLHRPASLQRWINFQSFLGLSLIFSSVWTIRSDSAFPGWLALVPTLGTFLVISAGAESWLNKHVLSNKVLVRLGLISYPLYLWHWPIFAFNWIIYGSFNGHMQRLVSILFAILLAWLTYFFIEKPIRTKGNYRTAAALAAVMVAIAVAALFIMANRGFEWRAAVRNSTFNSEVERQFSGPIWNYTSNDLCTRRFPLQQAGAKAWWFCMLEKDAPPTMVILGNSYANQLYPGLIHQPTLAKENILSIGTCDASGGAKGSPCYREKMFLDGIVANNPSIHLVILAGLNPVPDDLYIEKLKERIDFFEAKGITAIVFTPHLRVDFDIRNCYKRPFFQATRVCTVSADQRAKLNANFKPLIDSIHATNPRVLFFDENDLFCDATSCNLIRDGLPLYRDEYHHVSLYGSDIIGAQFAEFLRNHHLDLH